MELHNYMMEVSEQYFFHSLSQDYRDEQIIQMYLAACAKVPNTRRNYFRALEHFREFLSGMPMKDVTWREIEAYKLYLSQGIYREGGRSRNNFV